MGDGTTARSRAGARWRRARWPLTILGIVVVVGVLTSVMGARTSTVPLAPDNPSSDGARAVAQILRNRGVRIDYVRTVTDAAARATEGTTLLVATSYTLDDAGVRSLRDATGDLVLVGVEAVHVPTLTGDALSTVAGYDDAPREAQCDDPDARAAGELVDHASSSLVADSADAVVCFPSAGDPTAGSYAVVDDGDRRIVVITDEGLMSNERLDDGGNAALVLRALGRHEHLVWLVPSFGDVGTQPSAPGPGDLMPPWFGPLAAQMLVVVLALALWRGRSLGPVVTEPLPVTVRAAETTLGRGRLYRRARSSGHAAAALRAGAARRCAARLGLPRSAGAPEVIDAMARATGRPTQEVAGLLYGPPPTDDAGLLQLARQLDDLESEVHRP